MTYEKGSRRLISPGSFEISDIYIIDIYISDICITDVPAFSGIRFRYLYISNVREYLTGH